MQIRQVLVLMWLAACSADGTIEVAADAAPAQIADSHFVCMPVAPVAGPTCLALGPAALVGTTPLGTVDVALEYFGAGDCITISLATISLRGACGESVSLRFSYPVTSDGGTRRVVQSFDATARFAIQPQGEASVERVTMVHVDVAKWQEGQGTHEIDIVVTVTDPMFSVSPLHVQGTFCDWPYQLC